MQWEWNLNPAVKKGLAIVAVALLLLIPLAWLHGLVSERTALREQAIAAVARGWGGRQMLAGPILAIPVTTTLDNGRTQTRDWYVLPESVDLDVEVTIQQERPGVAFPSRCWRRHCAPILVRATTNSLSS